MRRRFTLLFICGTVFAERTYAQEDSTAIEAIYGIVQEINKLDDLEPTVLENEAFLGEMTDRGGVLTAWSKNGRVVLLMEWVGLSSCEVVTQYYSNDQELVFVEVKGSESMYIDSTGTFDHRVQHPTMDARFYYQVDEVLKQEMSGSTRCGGAPEREWVAAYRMRAIKLVELFDL